MSESLYYLGFSVFPGIGPANFAKLLSRFETAENAWKAEDSALFQVLGAILGQKFVDFLKTFSLEKYAENLEEKKIGFVCLFEERYPKLLKGIQPHVILNGSEGSYSINNEETLFKERDSSVSPQNDKMTSTFLPPYVLYYKGNSALFDEEKTMGIVGTRKVTDYGREVTQKLTEELVRHDFVIVSGLAFGVDGIAHTTTLEKNGKTIAVLGGGVDVCTPVEHQKIYNDILENGGCIVSAVVPGERPIKGSFPARNKIVAGLSLGILVTEGAADSGALITADYAQKFDRPVFAIPGPITSDVSKGPNNLIKKGAIAITDAAEILDRLGIITHVKAQNSNVKAIKGNSPEEQEILNLLQINPLHFDDIVRKMSRDSSSIGSLLSLMELKGLIKILSDGKYGIS